MVTRWRPGLYSGRALLGAIRVFGRRGRSPAVIGRSADRQVLSWQSEVGDRLMTVWHVRQEFDRSIRQLPLTPSRQDTRQVRRHQPPSLQLGHVPYLDVGSMRTRSPVGPDETRSYRLKYLCLRSL